MGYILKNNKDAFYKLYKSTAEYNDKQSVLRNLYKKLVKKGVYDFKSKRSLQTIHRFRNKVTLLTNNNKFQEKSMLFEIDKELRITNYGKTGSMPCPNCNIKPKVYIVLPELGHDIPCCSIECGKAVGKRLEENQTTEKYKKALEEFLIAKNKLDRIRFEGINIPEIFQEDVCLNLI